MHNSSFQIEELEMAECSTSGSNRRGVSITAAGDAILVRGAEKSYESGKPVLNGMNMTVPCGSIYGLLGSSGCGKTTILSCIVGQRKLDNGEVWIFGNKPGTRSIGVPGRNIGYMPQDISLYTEFSIDETLQYFAALSGMAKEEVYSSKKFIVKFLDLPEGNRKVGTLSGGQQRRVSLATALIHDPELLILDEPTVGVDPFLRKSIWLHLQNLVCTRRTTVLITTHYIEECRQADNIGIMRGGRLLTEQPPSQLFQQYNTINLERIVLLLSRKDAVPKVGSSMTAAVVVGEHSNAAGTARKNETRSNGEYVAEEEFRMAYVMREQKPGLKDSLMRMRALAGKNFVVISRNPLLLYFVLFISALVLALICLALGKDPQYMNVGLINAEVKDYFSICPNVTRSPGECDTEYLSCRYLNSLPKNSFNFKLFDSEYDAVEEMKKGHIWGYVTFPEEFSTNLISRMLLGSNVDNVTLNGSEFYVQLDETNGFVAYEIKRKLFKTFTNFSKLLFLDCGYKEEHGELPLVYGEPIFGTDDTDFREFLAHGIAPSILFFYQIVTTSIRYISEKRNGVLERSLVGGVRSWEIMMAYSMTEFLSLLFQSVLCYTIITHIFGIPIAGSHPLIIFALFLNAYNGVSMGFLLGSVCTEEIQAAVLAMATFFPSLFLSGLIWPVEGMSPWLQNIAPFLPCTLSGEAIRSVGSRGWKFTHGNVWPGLLVPLVYIFIFFTLTVLFHKIVRK